MDIGVLLEIRQLGQHNTSHTTVVYNQRVIDGDMVVAAQSGWQCKQCKEQNPDEEDFCDKCFAPRRASGAPRETCRTCLHRHSTGKHCHVFVVNNKRRKRKAAVGARMNPYCRLERQEPYTAVVYGECVMCRSPCSCPALRRMWRAHPLS